MTYGKAIEWFRINRISIAFFFLIAGASQLWPNFMPWSFAFWLGWISGGWDSFHRDTFRKR